MQMLMDNSIIILFALLVLGKLIQLKIEYFPSKARYSEDLMDRYCRLQLYRRYQRETDRYLPRT